MYTVLVVGDIQSFLVVDKKVVCEIESFVDIPFCLMSALFVFNIHYPVGCSNLYAYTVFQTF